MSNQTSKVIASDKGQFKSTIPQIVALVIFAIIIVIGWIVLGWAEGNLNNALAESVDPNTTVEDAAFLVILEKAFKVFFIFSRVITALMALSIHFGLIWSIIGNSISHATLTETGIYGRNVDMRKYDLSLDEITLVEQLKSGIIIRYVNKKGKKKKISVCVSNPKEFAAACKAQLKSYKAAKAQVA